MQETIRTCTRCNTERPIEDFQRVGIRDYRRRVCAVCIAAYHHGYHIGVVKPIDRGASERKCRRCNEVKGIDEFPLLGGKYANKGVRKHVCWPCYRAENAAKEARRRKRLGEAYREENRIRQSEKRLSWSARRREAEKALKIEVMEAYGGVFCACCGDDILSGLTIDHINNDGAEHRREIFGGTRGGGQMYSWLKQQGFPDGFQVLCYTCNLSKHRNGGACEHHTRVKEFLWSCISSIEGSEAISSESSLQVENGKRSAC